MINRFELDASAGIIPKPSHQQVTTAAAIFEDVSAELGSNSRYHCYFHRTKRSSQTLVELNIHYGRMQISLGLNIKATERRPARIRVLTLVLGRIQVRIDHG